MLFFITNKYTLSSRIASVNQHSLPLGQGILLSLNCQTFSKYFFKTKFSSTQMIKCCRNLL